MALVAPMVLAALVALGAPPLAAWSPRCNEAQTTLAVRLVPRRMRAFLLTHPTELLQGARGQANDQVPTVEEVQEQFQQIVRITEDGRRPEQVVRELGVLAHQVQLLTDPSAVHGATALRDTFETYADEQLPRMVLCREPFWAVTGPIDPRPALLRWAQLKFERHQALAACFDPQTGRRLGQWDTLSVPVAQLQLAYSSGINATANIWIQLWRALGDQWVPRTGD